jgi:acetyl-CoA C-acetyltransferase
VPGVEGHVEEVHVVGILFGGGRSPASDLCRKLKLTPRRAATTTIGGNTPQWLLTRAAQAVADGEVAAVLIAGAEAVRSQQARAGAAHEPAGDGPSTDGADPVEGDPRPGLSEAEMSAGLAVPAQVYPMIESVLAERAGRSLAGQRRALGELMAAGTVEVVADLAGLEAQQGARRGVRGHLRPKRAGDRRSGHRPPR